jgi:hypothetical protein
MYVFGRNYKNVGFGVCFCCGKGGKMAGREGAKTASKTGQAGNAAGSILL